MKYCWLCEEKKAIKKIRRGWDVIWICEDCYDYSKDIEMETIKKLK